MRKFATVSLLLSLLLIVNLSPSAQTRQRRVGQASTTQPESPEAQPAPSNQKRPVLQTGTTISNSNRTPSPQQQSQTKAQTNDDPEEVGENDVVRVNTTLVTIPVSVMDRNGRFIPDLRQQEFRIYEDGVEHEVAYFASVEKPFTLALVLDTSGSTRFRLEEIQDAAIAFVNQLRPDDRVLIVSFDEEVRVLAEATNNRNVLRDAIRRTRTGGGTKLYDAVDLVINQRLNREQGRKAVILFTDGVDTASTRASYQSNIRDAEEIDALIYPVQYDTSSDMNAGGGGGGGTNWPSGKGGSRSTTGILIDILGGIMSGRGGNGGGGGGSNRGPVIFGGGTNGSSPEDYRRADSYLRDLAYKTGAKVFRAETTRDLAQSFALIAEELRRQYSLGYYPKTVAQSGTRHQIRVRVMRPNLVVRARDSYIAGSQTGATTAQGNTQPSSRPELKKRPLVEMRRDIR
jgi:Ca-activated chloride channel family protein